MNEKITNNFNNLNHILDQYLKSEGELQGHRYLQLQNDGTLRITPEKKDASTLTQISLYLFKLSSNLSNQKLNAKQIKDLKVKLEQLNVVENQTTFQKIKNFIPNLILSRTIKNLEKESLKAPINERISTLTQAVREVFDSIQTEDAQRKYIKIDFKTLKASSTEKRTQATAMLSLSKHIQRLVKEASNDPSLKKDLKIMNLNLIKLHKFDKRYQYKINYFANKYLKEVISVEKKIKFKEVPEIDKENLIYQKTFQKQLLSGEAVSPNRFDTLIQNPIISIQNLTKSFENTFPDLSSGTVKPEFLRKKATYIFDQYLQIKTDQLQSKQITPKEALKDFKPFFLESQILSPETFDFQPDSFKDLMGKIIYNSTRMQPSYELIQKLIHEGDNQLENELNKKIQEKFIGAIDRQMVNNSESVQNRLYLLSINPDKINLKSIVETFFELKNSDPSLVNFLKENISIFSERNPNLEELYSLLFEALEKNDPVNLVQSLVSKNYIEDNLLLKETLKGVLLSANPFNVSIEKTVASEAILLSDHPQIQELREKLFAGTWGEDEIQEVEVDFFSEEEKKDINATLDRFLDSPDMLQALEKYFYSDIFTHSMEINNSEIVTIIQETLRGEKIDITPKEIGYPNPNGVKAPGQIAADFHRFNHVVNGEKIYSLMDEKRDAGTAYLKALNAFPENFEKILLVFTQGLYAPNYLAVSTLIGNDYKPSNSSIQQSYSTLGDQIIVTSKINFRIQSLQDGEFTGENIIAKNTFSFPKEFLKEENFEKLLSFEPPCQVITSYSIQVPDKIVNEMFEEF